MAKRYVGSVMVAVGGVANCSFIRAERGFASFDEAMEYATTEAVFGAAYGLSDYGPILSHTPSVAIRNERHDTLATITDIHDMAPRVPVGRLAHVPCPERDFGVELRTTPCGTVWRRVDSGLYQAVRVDRPAKMRDCIGFAHR